MAWDLVQPLEPTRVGISIPVHKLYCLGNGTLKLWRACGPALSELAAKESHQGFYAVGS